MMCIDDEFPYILLLISFIHSDASAKILVVAALSKYILCCILLIIALPLIEPYFATIA